MKSLSQIIVVGLLIALIGSILNVSAAEIDPKVLQKKLTDIRSQAQTLRTEKKTKDLEALYLKALEDSDFKDVPARADIFMMLGDFYRSQKDNDKAKDYFQQAADTPNISRFAAINATKNLVRVLLVLNQFDEAKARLNKFLAIKDLTPQEKTDIFINLAKVSQQEGDLPMAKEYLLKALNVEGATPATKKSALSELLEFYKSSNDWPEFQKSLAELRALGDPLNGIVLNNYLFMAQANSKPEEEKKARLEIIANPKLQPAQLSTSAQGMIDFLTNQGDINGIKTFITSLDGRELTDEMKAYLKLLTASLAVPENGWGQFKAPSLDPLDAEKQAKVFFDLGKFMMRLRNVEGARFFAQKGEGLFGKDEERLYKVPFMDKAPRGVSAWEASPLVKDPSRRESRFEEYNKKAAALLIYDVNAARTVVTDDTQKQAPVSFYMAADARGWHVYLQYKDDEAEQVLAGLVPGGSLEMYFEPGKGEVYYQMLLEVPSGKTLLMDWSSPNPRYRKLGDYLVSEVAPIDGGFGVSLIFPWELIYDKLPDSDARWPFGVVNFGRKGAFTWGSGQVHELSRFGKVTFPEIQKALPDIHRWIVMKAYAKFKNSAKEMDLVWNDREKGDVEFFNAIVKPEIERLTELGKVVSPTMSKEDSERLFKEAVPSWMEFDYLVAEKRARYLSEKLVAQ